MKGEGVWVRVREGVGEDLGKDVSEVAGEDVGVRVEGGGWRVRVRVRVRMWVKGEG